MMARNDIMDMFGWTWNSVFMIKVNNWCMDICMLHALRFWRMAYWFSVAAIWKDKIGWNDLGMYVNAERASRHLCIFYCRDREKTKRRMALSTRNKRENLVLDEKIFSILELTLVQILVQEHHGQMKGKFWDGIFGISCFRAMFNGYIDDCDRKDLMKASGRRDISFARKAQFKTTSTLLIQMRSIDQTNNFDQSHCDRSIRLFS